MARNPDPEFGWIGKRIKDIREKRGLSQRKFAEQCNVDIGIVSRMESGESEPTLKTLRLIAQGPGITVSALLFQGEREVEKAIDTLALKCEARQLVEQLQEALVSAKAILDSLS